MLQYARAPDINFTPRNKKKQGKSLRRDQVKRIIQQDAKKVSFINLTYSISSSNFNLAANFDNSVKDVILIVFNQEKINIHLN